MLRRYAPFALLLVLIGIAVPTTQVFGEGETTIENASPCVSKTDNSRAVKSLAKRAWKQAKGPTQIQRDQFNNYLTCSANQHKLLGIWHDAKIHYKRDRYLARLDQKCKDNTVVSCIRYASTLYHQSYSHAYSVAYRESTLNRFASNGSHWGLYQFDGPTWTGSPYDDNGSINSARWNSLAAMWYWSRGEYGRWAQTY